MQIHVLSGDSFTGQFEKLELGDEVIVCRECLVDGDLNTDSLEAFWEARESYLNAAYPDAGIDYREQVADEFVRLWNLADGNDVNLWFEYELFCQVNLWFCLWLLRNTEANVYCVYPALPEDIDLWKGFSHLGSQELRESLSLRIKLEHDDFYLGIQLWEAFAARDWEAMRTLGDSKSKCFPTLKQVSDAAAEIETRPEATLRKIISAGKDEFGQAYSEFCRIEGVYGFGDLQVKRLFERIIEEG